MKMLIVAVILFALMLGGIIFNYIYVNKASDSLCELIRGLPEASSETSHDALSSLRAEWGSRRVIISFSSNISKLKQIDDLMASLEIYSDNSCPTEFERTAALLINAISELAEFESLKFENLF